MGISSLPNSRTKESGIHFMQTTNLKIRDEGSRIQDPSITSLPFPHGITSHFLFIEYMYLCEEYLHLKIRESSAQAHPSSVTVWQRREWMQILIIRIFEPSRRLERLRVCDVFLHITSDKCWKHDLNLKLY